MENSGISEQKWFDQDGNEIARIEINDAAGILIRVSLATLGSHRKEMEELLTLSLYPPREEENSKGAVSSDGLWITYETKKGSKWELAKIDIVNTFHFWFG